MRFRISMVSSGSILLAFWAGSARLRQSRSSASRAGSDGNDLRSGVARERARRYQDEARSRQDPALRRGEVQLLRRTLLRLVRAP